VPIILAAFVVLAGVAGAERVFDLVFFIVVVNTLIPGAFIRRAARWLGADAPERPTPAAVLEINAPHQFDGELQSYFIHPSLVVAGATLSEIPLPDDANVMLVVRGRQLLAGRGDTKLEVGDHVYVFFRPAERALIELLFGRAEEMG
jgi:cell volume regulation protein A